jgi:hypothetical protein
MIAALHWAVLDAPRPVEERPPSPASAATVVVTAQATQAQTPRPDSAPTVTRPRTAPRTAASAPLPEPAATSPKPRLDPPPTQIPATQDWGFVAEQGAQHSAATLRWSHDGEQYTLTLDAPGWLAMRSQGSFDAWGLAPTRYTERRRPRSERALTMERPADGAPGRVAYSAHSEPGPLAPGLQDRLSWLLQAQALVAAGVPPPGKHLSLQIASPGGDQQPWRLERLPPEPEDGGVIKFRHEPLRPYDNRVELWLEGAPPHAALRVWLASARGEPLLLTRVPERAEPASTSDPEAPK